MIRYPTVVDPVGRARTENLMLFSLPQNHQNKYHNSIFIYIYHTHSTDTLEREAALESAQHLIRNYYYCYYFQFCSTNDGLHRDESSPVDQTQERGRRRSIAVIRVDVLSSACHR